MNATSTMSSASVSTRISSILPVIAIAAYAGEVLIVARWPNPHGPTVVARELGVNAVWVVVALLARRLRPTRPMWVVMLAFAMLLTIVGPVGLGVRDPGWFAAVVTSVGIALVPYQVPLGAQVLLAFPSGRLVERSRRRLIHVTYLYATIESAVLMSTMPRQSDRCGGPCPENLANVVDDPRIHVAATRIIAMGWIVLAGWCAMVIVWRYARSGRRERRILRPPYIATAVVIAAFSWLALFSARTGGNVFGAGPSPDLVGIAVLQLAIAAVPLCFLVGLLRERLAYSGVSDLVRDLEPRDGDVRDLTDAVARTLGDPTLQIAIPVGDRLLDLSGCPVVVSPGARLTTVGEPGQPLAILVHAPSLHDEPELLVAAGSALRLALDNRRLHYEVDAQLAEVRESRARIVVAGDEARRRIERDLHDGAQQRLLTVGLALQLLRLRLADDAASELLSEVESELAKAIHELRALAAGIHPAVLTDQGLLPAITTLADRCPLPVSIVGDDPGRLPAPIESAAYFCTSEALTNALKHAGCARIIVELRRTTDRAMITISDDGRGGADPAGSGLRGLADRVFAVNGSFGVSRSDSGGTRITVKLPCA